MPEYFTKEQAEETRKAFEQILDEMKFEQRANVRRCITTVHIFIEEAKRHAPAEERKVTP